MLFYYDNDGDNDDDDDDDDYDDQVSMSGTVYRRVKLHWILYFK